MREIKFRAWHKEQKRWLDISKLNFDLKCVEVWREEYLDYEFAYFDQIELMQYTGFKDKNGKEIYEGDILRYEGIDDENYDVRFSNYSGCWMGCNELYADVNRSFAVEIIGNIHENKEIL